MLIHQTQLEGQVKEIIEGSLATLGYELVRVSLKGSGRDRTLQIMIDRIDGEPINISDCQAASNNISVLMDVDDPIDGRYSLELSSAGLYRPLTRHKDFVKHQSNKIKVSTKLSVEGRKNIYGMLAEVTNAGISVYDTELKKTFNVEFGNISEAHLNNDYDDANAKKAKKGTGELKNKAEKSFKDDNKPKPKKMIK